MLRLNFFAKAQRVSCKKFVLNGTQFETFCSLFFSQTIFRVTIVGLEMYKQGGALPKIGYQTFIFHMIKTNSPE